jgi:hypothetical protein
MNSWANQAYHIAPADSACCVFPQVCSRIVNNDFLCYQVYESVVAMKSQVVYFFAPLYPRKIQLMRELKKLPTSGANSP